MYRIDNRPSGYVPTLRVCSFHPRHPENYKLQDIDLLKRGVHFSQLLLENTLFGGAIATRAIEAHEDRHITAVLDALKAIDDMYECQLHVIGGTNPFDDVDTSIQMRKIIEIRELKALREYRQRIRNLIKQCTVL